jgi:hypothetical protein
VIKPDIGYDQDLGSKDPLRLDKERFGPDTHHLYHKRPHSEPRSLSQHLFLLEDSRQAFSADFLFSSIGKDDNRSRAGGLAEDRKPGLSEGSGDESCQRRFPSRSRDGNPNGNPFPLPRQPKAFEE